MSDTSTNKGTRERRLQRALEKSEARFQQVVEQAPHAMVMIRDTGQIEMVNAQAEAMFGYPRSELLGQPVEMLAPLRFQAGHPHMRDAFFAAPRSRPVGDGRDLYGRHKNGSEFPVEIGLNPIETEDGAMVLSSIVDISERRLREDRVRAALKEKELLLGEVHHRVKNNLQVIHSLLYLQSSKVEDPATAALLQESQNRISSMALIHQTLYESKDFAFVDFDSFLAGLAPNLVASYSIDPGRISLTINATHVLLPIQSAVPCGLIVNELISNALKHAFPPGARGRIEVELKNLPGDRVMLSVSDDGRGMPEDLDLAKATTLGLQLVSLLSEQLKGELVINRSKPTRFALTFRRGP